MVHRAIESWIALWTTALWERGLREVAPVEAPGPTVGRRTRVARHCGGASSRRADGPSLCPGPTIPDAGASRKLTHLRTTRVEPMARPCRRLPGGDPFLDIPGSREAVRCISLRETRSRRTSPVYGGGGPRIARWRGVHLAPRSTIGRIDKRKRLPPSSGLCPVSSPASGGGSPTARSALTD